MQLTEQKIDYFKTNKKMGRSKKYTSREQKAILSTLKKDRFTSANEIKNFNNLNFLSKTVSRVLKNNDLHIKKIKNTLILKAPHKNRRLHFAKTNVLNDFTTWVMSRAPQICGIVICVYAVKNRQNIMLYALKSTQNMTLYAVINL